MFYLDYYLKLTFIKTSPVTPFVDMRSTKNVNSYNYNVANFNIFVFLWDKQRNTAVMRHLTDCGFFTYFKFDTVCWVTVN